MTNPFIQIPSTDEETPYNNKKYFNKINNNNNEIINVSGEMINDNDENSENSYIEDLECEEFKDFSPDAWKRLYPKDERIFKFPKEGIIHDKTIINNEGIYKGDINENGEKHGFGKFISPTIKRIGMWRRNNFNGWGREITKNGSFYEGKFVDGKLNGKGMYKSKKNKSTYIGEFLNSMKHGKGELYTNDFHYKGEFSYNKLNGKGKIEIYNDGEYEGTFKDNQFEGKGMFKWNDGRCYIGEVSKGKMNGYGEETLSDGKIYKGYFVDGVKNGKGKIYSNGKIIGMKFKNGKIINVKDETNSNDNSFALMNYNYYI